MTDQMADNMGREAGDEYFADLDLIESVVGEKERQGIDLIDDAGIASDDADDAESDQRCSLLFPLWFTFVRDCRFCAPIRASLFPHGNNLTELKRNCALTRAVLKADSRRLVISHARPRLFGLG